ncbi:hypothetical protein AC480_05580 [miscellaneous Crenarchaeota group archaeon SMTZ1-55]|nr:MAG: hypothetical protein AC480_05580 [miscellaneous Crenarchaeota group archaeon SMTZ1-55]
MKKRVDALTIPSGPTVSGLPAPNGNNFVGGEIVSIDKLSLLLSQPWVLLMLLLLPLSILLYKKRNAVFLRFLRRLRIS